MRNVCLRTTVLDCWYQFGDKVQGQPDGVFKRKHMPPPPPPPPTHTHTHFIELYDHCELENSIKVTKFVLSDFIWPFLRPYMGVIPNPKMVFIFP